AILVPEDVAVQHVRPGEVDEVMPDQYAPRRDAPVRVRLPRREIDRVLPDLILPGTVRRLPRRRNRDHLERIHMDVEWMRNCGAILDQPVFQRVQLDALVNLRSVLLELLPVDGEVWRRADRGRTGTARGTRPSGVPSELDGSRRRFRRRLQIV